MESPTDEHHTEEQTLIVHLSPRKSEKQFTLKECLRRIAYYSKKAEELIGRH